ncbi:urease accessory protein UreD [Bacillus cihuensis]|uniref:urease accessory protein UreD n=1 Tax=Bacillus cihuensis TaxID=1208599 RepID=UPI0004204886|nr:urease accessory protein UreD [Bacillus cihuensis]
MQEGMLELGIKVDQNEKSYISRMNYRFPLKVMRPFYMDDMGTAFVYVFDTAGGMLAGDRADYSISVEDCARLYLTNASTSKIYQMPEGKAFINQHFHVGENASLECFPEAITLFRQSELETQTRIDVHPKSVLAYCEMYSSGRKSTGESFEFRSLSNRLHLYIGGKLAIWEQFRLNMEREQFARLGYLEGYSHWGTLYLYAGQGKADSIRRLQEYLSTKDRLSVRAGCSLHPSGVITMKVLSSNYEEMTELFNDVWSFMRPLMLKGELPYIRK